MSGSAVEFGESLGVPMMVGNAVKQLLSITKQSQGADADLTRTVVHGREVGRRRSEGKNRRLTS